MLAHASIRSVSLAAVLVAGFSGGALAQQPRPPAPAPSPSAPSAVLIDGRIGLSALMALTDGKLQEVADSYALIAGLPEVQSGDWAKIGHVLEQAAAFNVEALNWFALPDGSYWSVQNGREKGNLKDRSYFAPLLAGKPVIGELVVSKATGKSTAIVAIPVVRPDKTVVGALGASVYLDRVSEQLKKELNIDTSKNIFYSFNAQPIVGIDWDPSLIFADRTKLGPEVSAAFDEMMRRGQGVITYTFRGRPRTLLFAKSPVTSWWYAFGTVRAAAPQ